MAGLVPSSRPSMEIAISLISRSPNRFMCKMCIPGHWLASCGRSSSRNEARISNRNSPDFSVSCCMMVRLSPTMWQSSISSRMGASQRSNRLRMTPVNCCWKSCGSMTVSGIGRPSTRSISGTTILIVPASSSLTSTSNARRNSACEIWSTAPGSLRRGRSARPCHAPSPASELHQAIVTCQPRSRLRSATRFLCLGPHHPAPW